MDSNNKTNDTGKQSDNKSTDATLNPEFYSSPDIASNQNERSGVENKTGKINQWKEYSKKWIDPLTIVTIILAIATYMLYKQATKDSTIVEDSANTAKEAVREQRFNDSINRIEQIKKDSIDSITREITFASIRSSDSISKVTLQQQINAFKNDSISRKISESVSLGNLKAQQEILNETKYEFRSANTPYLDALTLVSVTSQIKQL